MLGVSQRIHRYALIVATSSAVVFLVALDSALLNVAFPAMVRSFPSTSMARMGWVISAYSVTLAILLLPAAYLVDYVGRKILLNLGLAIFCIGAVGCAISLTPTQAALSRCLQAMGGAFALPASLSIVLASFTGHARAVAIGKWSSAGGMATALGPVLGSALLHFMSWRAVFWMHLPLGILVIFASHKFLESSKGQPGSPRVAAGVALAAFGMGGIIAACTGVSSHAGAYATDAATAGLGFSFMLAGGYIALCEQRFRHDFGNWVSACTSLATLCFGATFGAMLVGYDFVLAYRFGFSFSRAALMLAPIALLSVPAARASGRLQKGASSFPVLFAGTLALLGAVLAFLMFVRGLQFSIAVWSLLTVLSAVGIGLCFPALTFQAMRGVSPGSFALGSGLNQAFRHMGSALGVALLTSFGFDRSHEFTKLTLLLAMLSSGMMLFLVLGQMRRWRFEFVNSGGSATAKRA